MQTLPRLEASSDAVYVAWQDPSSRQWHTIARLAQVGSTYEFRFTRGAKAVKAVVKQLFNSNLGEHYISSDLISIFRNKIPPRSRSDFLKLASWLNLTGHESDFEMLGKFGLIPGSDGIIVYSAPIIRDGRYAVEFFMHGIRHTQGETGDHHRHGDVRTWCQMAQSGDRLFPLLDVQNDFDPNAVALRAENATILLGYVPRFYTTDLRSILVHPECASSAEFRILRNNAEAPIQLRMLCRFTSNVPLAFKPLDDEDHEMQPSLVPSHVT